MKAPPIDIGEAYDEHVWRVYGFFAYRTGRSVEAEDLTQATFERALRSAGRFDARKGSPGTWLMAIAHNLLIDHLRRPANRPSVPLTDQAQQSTDPGPESRLGVSPELETALAQLSDRERELIALRYGGDMTGPEIAELTGLSLANVQQILSRSLRRMRASIEDGRALSAE